MIVKAAINGGQTKAAHPAVPVTPQELAEAVAQCFAEGTSLFHLHVRSRTGAESLASDDVACTLEAVRAAAPAAEIGLTTGAWIIPDPLLREKALWEWTELPDFASVNFSEDGAFEVAQLLLSRGVSIEAGLCEPDDADRLVDSGIAPRVIRVLLEPQEQELNSALAKVIAIEQVLDAARVEAPRLQHGTSATTWGVMEDALTKGYDIRIGFEDTLLLPDGTTAASNSELIADARRKVQQRISRGRL